MKTLFTTILLASAVISAPAFADDTKEILAGNAAELSSTEMQTTEGAYGNSAVATANSGNVNQSLNILGRTIVRQNATATATATSNTRKSGWGWGWGW